MLNGEELGNQFFVSVFCELNGSEVSFCCYHFKSCANFRAKPMPDHLLEVPGVFDKLFQIVMFLEIQVVSGMCKKALPLREITFDFLEKNYILQ